jgi:hypothetical protein
VSRPKTNTNAPIEVAATLRDRPAYATAVHELLFAGAVIGTQYPFSRKHFSFTGHFGDSPCFRRAPSGQPLTVRVVVEAGGMP